MFRITKFVFYVLFFRIEDVSAFKLHKDLHKPTSLLGSPTNPSNTLEAPRFNIEQILNTTLITSVGQTVYLHCLVDNIGDRKVSSRTFICNRLLILC